MEFSFSTRRMSAAALALVTAAAGLQVAGPTAAAAATVTYRTERVNVSSTGAQSTGGAYYGDISGNGRFVTFESEATDLVPGDTNGYADIFVRDRQAGTTTRINLGPDGEQADWFSSDPVISADGRFVAFSTYAGNLLPGDSRDEIAQVYLYDRETGTLDRISDAADGTPGNDESRGLSISANGRFVAFETFATNLFPGKGRGNVARYDRVTGQLALVNVEDGGDGVSTASGSYWPSISSNGRFVAFASPETDMVPGDTNGQLDIFLRDMQAGTTERVSLSNDDQQTSAFSADPDVSDDGRFVTFWSDDTDLVPGDDNNGSDVFLRDVVAGTTELISAAPGGGSANSVSSDGNMSPDGRYVTYFSEATNIVPGDTNSAADVYVLDRLTGENRIVSRRNNGALGNSASFNGRISRNGQFFVYGSWATNLVRGDTNNETDLFVTRVTVS